MNVAKKIIKNITPPLLLNLLKSRNQFGWFGNYQNWEEAKSNCSGYDSSLILEKCQTAALKVKNGEAVFERDSILFYKSDYTHAWIILIGILHCALNESKNINILDFGGSLGSSYHQNKYILNTIDDLSLKWNIVEQKSFIKCGRDNFEEEKLKFYLTTDECLKENAPNILLLSSVMQYLEKPFEQLDKLLSLDTEYIIVDRTAFIKSETDIITIQKIPPSIYKASYPAWAFNEQKFLSRILGKYNMILEQDNLDKSNYPSMYFKGFIFKKKNG